MYGMKIHEIARSALYFILLFASLSLLAESDRLPPMEKLDIQLEFKDDLHFEHMLKAISRQEVYFKKKDLKVPIQIGERKLKREHLYKSLKEFRTLVVAALNCFQVSKSSTCYNDFKEQMQRKFEVYRPIPEEWERGAADKKTMFTAYYSPDLHGSMVQTDVYKNPIYAMPTDEKLARATSDEINYGGKLKNKGLELLYVKESLYDIWLLHVEGGGRVILEDDQGKKTHKYLSYKSSNKKSFSMLYEYMLAEGMLTKGAATISKQRKYFINHPEHQREILNSCESFIFFQITESEPLGVHNIPLTEQRSLATDYRRVKEYGMINFIKTKKPIFDNGEMRKEEFSRFFINQDTGGAIKGNARVDLYFGYGDKAELAANFVYGLGEQYYLILK